MSAPKLKDFPQPAQPAVGTIVRLPIDLRTKGAKNKHGIVVLWDKTRACKDCVLAEVDNCDDTFICARGNRADEKEVLLVPCTPSGELL
jgi:hypothetical protein